MYGNLSSRNSWVWICWNYKIAVKSYLTTTNSIEIHWLLHFQMNISKMAVHGDSDNFSHGSLHRMWQQCTLGEGECLGLSGICKFEVLVEWVCAGLVNYSWQTVTEKKLKIKVWLFSYLNYYTVNQPIFGCNLFWRMISWPIRVHENNSWWKNLLLVQL